MRLLRFARNDKTSVIARSPVVWGDAAISSMRHKDCHVSSLLAMTEWFSSAFAMMAAESTH